MTTSRAIAAVLILGAAVPAVADDVTVTGYLTDIYCWDRALDGMLALDGADMKREPQAHTVHCLLDIPECVESGFGVLTKSNGDVYDLAYTFDAAGNAKVLEALEATSKSADYVVTVKGEASGKTLKVSSFAEGDGSDDGAEVAVARRPIDGLLWGHALLMLSSWGCILPWGVAIASRARGVQGSTGDAWFKRHRSLQVTGWVLQLGGFFFAMAFVETYDAHFSSYHTFLGLATVILGTLQPLNALVRPHAAKGSAGPTAARRAWEVGHKATGYIAIVLGIVTASTGIATAMALNYAFALRDVAVTALVLGAGSALAFAVAAKTNAGRFCARRVCFANLPYVAGGAADDEAVIKQQAAASAAI